MFNATKINTDMTQSKLLQGLQKRDKKPLIYRNHQSQHKNIKKDRAQKDAVQDTL